MGKKLVSLFLRHRIVSLFLSFLILAGGYWTTRRIPLDSFPDMTPVRVEVDTQTSGLAAEEIEKLVTYPIEQALLGIPHVSNIRSLSKFTLSVVEVQFEPGTDIYWARAQVFQNLANASLPANVSPSMAPLDNGTGQVFIYALTSPKLNNLELRTLQEFLVKPQLRVVPGVADVPLFGGFVKQYQILLDPVKLTARGLGIADVITALGQNNVSTGGNFLSHGATQYVIRGLGLVQTLDDLRKVVIAAPNGIPVRMADVGEVKLGPEVRQGAVSMNGQGEVAAGIVIKRLGENTAAVIDRVKQKLAQLESTFQSGTKIYGLDTTGARFVTIYDQSYLIRHSVRTVTTSLIFGAILIILVHFLLLGHFRPTLIPLFSTLFCIMLAIFLMNQDGISANLLSLGGLALSLGMMVDATVMILENVYRHILEVPHPGMSREQIIAEGAAEIMRPTIFAIFVIVAVFIPVLALRGIEGQLFIPLALAVVFSMAGSLLMAGALTPILCTWLIPLKEKEKEPGKPFIVMRILQKLYQPWLHASIKSPVAVVAVSGIILLASVWTFLYTGSEFLPSLEEGNFRIRFTLPPSTSLPAALAFSKRVEKTILKTLPEAVSVVSYLGRPELGGDPEALSNDEVYVKLKPIPQWRHTKAELEEMLREKLEGIPGVNVQFSQELEMRTDEMISGFDTPIAVYLLGREPKVMLEKAREIERILKETPHSTDVSVEHFMGVDNLDIVPDRLKMERYGISIQNVMDVVGGSIGGTSAGQVFLQNQRFDIQVRMLPQFRTDLNAIGKLLVASPSGLRVPLRDVAEIRYETGFDHIDRWNGMRRIVIMADVKGRSIGGFVADAKKRIAQEVKLPPGYAIHWGGQAEEAEHAFEGLTFAIPAALAAVFLLIYLCFDNIVDTLIVLATVPLGIAGGTFLLMILGLHFNVPAYIGFIAKFGIAVQNGMIMVAYMNILKKKGLSAAEAAHEGAMTRLRPELLSAVIGSIGLVPFLIASGTGATVERPLAAVVIGGVLVSRPMAWFLLPALYAWLKKEPAAR